MRRVPGLDVSLLSVDDAVVALASLARRWREALVAEPDEELDEVLARIGPDGRSGQDLVADTACSLTLLARALEQAVDEHEPVVHPAVTDPTARTWSLPSGVASADLSELISDELDTLRTRAQRVSTVAWRRPVTVGGGGTTDALHILREAVRTTSDNLRALQRALRTARQR
jgi:hypothetical protein